MEQAKFREFFRKFGNTFSLHISAGISSITGTFRVPFTRDVGVSLPTERELMWTRKRTINNSENLYQ